MLSFTACFVARKIRKTIRLFALSTPCLFSFIRALNWQVSLLICPFLALSLVWCMEFTRVRQQQYITKTFQGLKLLILLCFIFKLLSGHLGDFLLLLFLLFVPYSILLEVKPLFEASNFENHFRPRSKVFKFEKQKYEPFLSVCLIFKIGSLIKFSIVLFSLLPFHCEVYCIESRSSFSHHMRTVVFMLVMVSHRK